MDEIAEPAPHAPFAAIETAARLAEIGHGGKLAVDGTGGVPAGIERVAGLLGRILVFEARVDVADEIYFIPSKKIGKGGKEKEGEKKKKNHTIIIIITNHHLLHLAVLAHLAPEILIEGVEVVLQLAGVHLVLGVVGWVLVQVG